MKDFYWDIRPKPEFGTIEVRVCDTPLTVEIAAAIACYIQSMSRYIMVEQRTAPEEDDYLVYTFNRFQACRFGLEGVFIDPRTHEQRSIREDITDMLARITDHARNCMRRKRWNASAKYLLRATAQAGCARHMRANTISAMSCNCRPNCGWVIEGIALACPHKCPARYGSACRHVSCITRPRN